VSQKARELGVRHLQSPTQSTHEDVLAAPVKLERIAQLEAHRHEGRTPGLLGPAFTPAPDPDHHARVAPGITQSLDLLEQRLGRSPIARRPIRIDAQRSLQLLDPRVQYAALRPRRVPRLGHALLAQPPLHRIPRQPRTAADLSDGQPIPQVHSPDLGQHAHVDHSCFPCSFLEQASVVTWVRFRRSQPLWVGQFWVIVNRLSLV